MSTTISFDKSFWLEIKHVLFGKELLGCVYCGKRINKTNIGGVERMNGKTTVYCGSLSCLIKASHPPKKRKGG